MKRKLTLNGIEVTQPEPVPIENMVDESYCEKFKQGTVYGKMQQGQIIRLEKFEQMKDGYYKVKEEIFNKEKKSLNFNLELLKERIS